ncbi:flagellar motor protein [Pseudoteredinibacter isoporae]|uniref:Chemotaxis protein MotA n=1 Tax=Pseudoteredinibacter isoporae TaxID=570281 RepID=A0A7X0JXQ9_9GAMM|nr:flagellar motor protein [Pseudoteredinibacter isoporae]MBB6523450.1 chemotaxis protein MotA [Pseudoteredinibacter isoporae]NHO88959.1 flagellar motor protein [Pseudoteredinibacter isoporae]NIB24333.1 flagellar motor protein [Pseudoteredinibacter isoporae]
MDLLTLIGLAIGTAALLGGNFLEGGSLQSLLNGPAALIVIGGTLGAAVLQTPQPHLQRALKLGKRIFYPQYPAFDAGIKRVVNWAVVARREGLLGLEPIADKEKDRFAHKALLLLIDGNDTQVIRQSLEIDMIAQEQRDHNAASFYESMGGYAPTIGIIGAVIGLIHVMKNLSDPSQLGPGIAVAFVATIYGVAFANLFLLPIANKLKQSVNADSLYRELIIEGIVAIAEGENPRSIEIKLQGFLPR